MGNHEVDTGSLPYGIYDVEVEVVVNGKVVDKRMQRVNKLFSPNRGANAPLARNSGAGCCTWTTGAANGNATARQRTLICLALRLPAICKRLIGRCRGIRLTATPSASRVSLPVTESIQINLQNMAASDRSRSLVNSVSAALPGGFSSVWINQEKTQIGDRLLQNDAYNRAVGGSLNLGALWSPLGTLSASYNDDKKNDSHYYNADYYQNIFTGRFGTLGVRAGVQRYNNGSSNANTGKYIALDFSLPMGNWLSAGVSNQNGYTTANRGAQGHQGRADPHPRGQPVAGDFR